MNTNTNIINKFDYLYPLLENSLKKKLVNQPIINITNPIFKSSTNLYKRVFIKFEINDSKNFKYNYQELYLYRNDILYRNIILYDNKTRCLINYKKVFKKKLNEKLNEKQMVKKELENNILNEEIERLTKTIAKLQKKIKHI